MHFIRNFPKDINKSHLKILDDTFNLTNSYIAMVWFEQAINNNYRGNNIDSKIEDFLTTVGRRWYVSTLFKAYVKNNKREEALNIYKKSRQNYHSVTTNTIDALLDYKPKN